MIYKDNFAILTGEITLTKSYNPGTSFKETRKENIEYPNGFNKDNCALIAFATNKTTNSNKYYTCDSNVASSAPGGVTGNVPRSAMLSDKITLVFNNWMGSDVTIHYEVILMKIN